MNPNKLIAAIHNWPYNPNADVEILLASDSVARILKGDREELKNLLIRAMKTGHRDARYQAIDVILEQDD